MTDDAARLRRVRELFDRASELPPEAREAFLAAADGWSADERAEVRELLAGAESTAPWLASPPAGFADAVAGADLVGHRLGPWNVVREIGRGGMGMVYEAVRADDQYRQRAAIKLVQSAHDSSVTLARFRRERQILANLQHRNIATLLDGGVSPEGRPFLVMEYVEGEPITSWCDRRELSVRARVALFRQVCGAVQHAHRNLVIHRDLKPGNILVTVDGDVKLLDFGIARLLGPDGGEEDLPLTRGGARAYTPEYASPEQVRGETLTTATDVWSLGVVLCELLAGRRPHAVSGGGVAAIERAVLEQPARRPSDVATEAAARARGLPGAARLRAELARELDSIVLQALRPEPEQRWRSVEAFADDLKRYLDGLPVEAQRGWTGYRLRKFVERRRTAIAASAIVLLALVGGVVATSIEASRARGAQARAERVRDFLGTVLSSVKPTTGGRDVPVSELLDATAKRIGTELAGEPGVRGELEDVIGQSYLALGRPDAAEQHLRDAVRLRAIADGPRTVGVVLATSDLGFAFLSQGELGAADSTLRAALALKRSFAPRPDTIDAVVLDNLGSVAHAAGQLADAERYHREALVIRERWLAPDDDRLVTAINNVAVALGDEGHWAAAESLSRRAVAIAKRNHPEPATLVADAENSLATAIDIQGRAEEAEPIYREVLRLRGKLLGLDHPDYAFTLMNFAMFVFDRGHHTEAESLSRQVLALRGRTLPDGNPAVPMALQTLGRCLDLDGRTGEGGQALEQSLELRRKYLGPGHWAVASSEGILGEHYTHVRDYPRAERLLLDADRIFVAKMGETHARTVKNLERLTALYQAWGRADRLRAVQARIAAAKS